MSYTKEALQLRKPHIIDLPKISERISYLYVSKARVEQTQTGVCVIWNAESLYSGESVIPSANLNLLLLGPGTSITTPAATTLHRSGCSIIFCGEGMTGYACATPLTSRSGWAQAQARMWAKQENRLETAQKLYQIRYGEDLDTTGVPLQTLRGSEGQRMKKKYQELSKKYGYVKWKRETDTEKQTDGVNPLLNLGNAILYSSALSVCSALTLNPALGIIHQGSSKALLYDLADMYKVQSSLPYAFKYGKSPNGTQLMRNSMRDFLVKENLFKTMLTQITDLLTPFYQAADKDEILDDNGFVSGHKNYGTRT